MANQPQNNTSISRLFSDNRWLIFVILLLILLYELRPVITPFLAATILAYICDPLVDKLSNAGIKQFRIGRTLATLITLAAIIFGVFGVILILIPLLQKQSTLIVDRLPTLIGHFRETVEPLLKQYLDIDLGINVNQIQEVITNNWKETGDILGNVLKTAGSKGMALFGVAANLLLLPIVMFYILRDWDNIVENIAELIPRQWQDTSTKIAKEIDYVIAQFLRGQLSVMAGLSIFYSLGLWFTGLEMALSIGLIAGLLSFIPYLGFAVGFIMAVVLALLQFNSLTGVIPVLVVFGIGQLIESYVLTPYLVGDRIGLHPVIVILALLAGGQLFGFAGVLLALPVSAAIAVSLRYFRQSYLASDAYLK